MHPTKEKLEFGRKKSAGFLNGGRGVRLKLTGCKTRPLPVARMGQA